MIHVLVHENRSRSRLSLLLRELGQPAVFHNDLDSLLVSTRHDERKTDPVLFDLHSRTSDGGTCFPLLRKELEGRALIGFEELDPDSMDQGKERTDELLHYLLLPPQAERAKSRLKTVLAESRRMRNGSPSPAKTVSPKGFRRAFSPTTTARHFPRKPVASRPATGEKPFRYYMAQSPASREFGRKLQDSLSFGTLLMLSGETGAEFILAAREIQYQLHGDDENLMIVPADEVTLESLHSLEKEAKDSGKQRLCYLEQCEDAPPAAAGDILRFVENIENMRNPHLRLIFGREEVCDFLYDESAEIFSRLWEKRLWLRLPSLAERLEDIRPIASGFLSALSYAHPFLTVKEIDTEALRYLEENRSRFSYQKLVQVLRNSIALGQARILTAETIRNFETRSITAEHLVESTADDAYFPQREICRAS